MTPLLLSLSLALASGGASAEDCADVYDRTEACRAPEVTGLAVRPDAAPKRAAPRDASVDSFGWRLLAASGVTSVVGVALSGATFAYNAHLAALRTAGQASPANTERALFERSVVGWGAALTFAGAGLLLGSAGAFFIFDPQEGTAREPFRIPPE